ncbi:uncharacterized protein artn [Denticeps clupeoides]|uniref:TGF-beta family profile domain-containing protein n=1 Tax=Denticeps clupeoides TaxID=299321 RepID=A0AAY4DJN7_9TELE|nr:uncharacterized protein LOC114802429 [Denticeps clupeoides]
MTGEVVPGRHDGKRWWRLEVRPLSPSQYHLSNWRVTLWVLVSLLTQVEGTFTGAEKGLEDSHTSVMKTTDRMAWYPHDYSEGQNEKEAEKATTSLSGLFGDVSTVDTADDHRKRWQRSLSDHASRRRSRKNRKKGQSSPDCRMEKRQVRVKDLDLGHDSDEIIVFKFCVGTCSSARKNYDLALKKLMDKGSIPNRKVSTQPCCRPTSYETVSFMDTHTIWQTIKWLSAANCSCVG